MVDDGVEEAVRHADDPGGSFVGVLEVDHVDHLLVDVDAVGGGPALVSPGQTGRSRLGIRKTQNYIEVFSFAAFSILTLMTWMVPLSA